MKDELLAVPVVHLAKIKQWYLPVNIEDYNILKSFGLPLTRLHKDFLPTISLLNLQEKKLAADIIDFEDSILNPFLDKIGDTWQKKKGRKAKLTSKVLIFETIDPSIKAVTLPLYDKLEIALRRFFTRWGFSSTFEYSENRGKCKLHVSYKWESSIHPVIPTVEDPQDYVPVVIDLGFVRLTLTPTPKNVQINVSIAAGTGWSSIYTTTALYSQISDVRPMVKALMNIPNQIPENLDTKPQGSELVNK